MLNLLFKWLSSLFNKPAPIPEPVVVPEPVQPVPQPIVEPEQPKYMWDNPTFVRHSIRVICDEEGLDLAQKNTLCATIQCESGFNTKAVNYNKVNGKVVSTDYGLCQWNDYYHSKEITPDEALHNPEKAVRLMCKYWKQGLEKSWVCYSTGRFAKYL